MKVLIAVLVAAFVICSPTMAHAYNITWGYETWSDTTPADGHVDEWGRYQVDFVPGTQGGESIGITTIDTGKSWGKVYYGTGKSSTDIINTYHYLFLETYDIQGDAKVALSGDADADIYMAVPHMISWSGTTDPRDVTGNVIYNPGQYVMDVSGWAPGSTWSSTSFQLFAEGASGEGFKVRRVFLADENPLAPIPEPTSMLLLGSGLLGLFGISRKRK